MNDRLRQLALLENDVRACTACRLHETRTNTVFARGNPEAVLCFIGEAPGEKEDACGTPFVGAAGKLLDTMIGAMGFTPGDVYICNVVKCRPPENRKPEPDEMAACREFLNVQLATVRPRMIVALGATAYHALCGGTLPIAKARGTWNEVGRHEIMPTFHPAYLLRNPAAKADVWADLQLVMKRLGR